MIPYGITIVSSAFLLFLVQPIIAQQTLSWFGETAVPRGQQSHDRAGDERRAAVDGTRAGRRPRDDVRRDRGRRLLQRLNPGAPDDAVRKQTSKIDAIPGLPIWTDPFNNLFKFFQ